MNSTGLINGWDHLLNWGYEHKFEQNEICSVYEHMEFLSKTFLDTLKTFSYQYQPDRFFNRTIVLGFDLGNK